MANITETSSFDAGVYQLEIADPVVGGVTGVANSQARALANRTRYLKNSVDALAISMNAAATLLSPVLSGDPRAPTPALGDNDTSIANTEFVQKTVGGFLVKNVAGGANVTLTAVEAGNAIIRLIGALTANIALIVPAVTRSWIIVNETGGAYTVTVRTSAGAGVVVPQACITPVLSDSVNVSYAHNGFLDVDLIGTPRAPTAAAGTNSTQIANTAFVATAVANLIGPASASLNTLNELAGALGNDPNFASTMNNALAAKQNAATAINTSNIGAQNVAYASNSGNADTFDGLNSTAFARLDLAQSFNGAQRGTVVGLSDAATIPVDLALGNNFVITLGGNRVLGAPSNLSAGQSGIITIAQDATGGRTLAFATTWKFSGGVVPQVSSAPFSINQLAYYVNPNGTSIFAALSKDVR